ncbi:MAG TPA: hypothetical protein VGT44_09450 [Ktedonobacteraceae bacterium]|nr:hypothetical protein [Ktedonobacteraceae bacterium]
MNMSESNNRKNHEEEDSSSLHVMHTSLPADFSQDDLEFAQELNTLLSPQDEELPPYYVQTLMAAEDPRYQPVDQNFTLMTSARVFRSLHLRRRLFPTRRSLPVAFSDAFRDAFSRKAALVWIATFMLIMLCTVAFTAPSFERGMVYLLQGTRSGTMGVHKFPDHVKHSPYFADADFSSAPPQISLLATQQQLHFKMYWPQFIPAKYQLSSINIYEDPGNTWADGPILELVYSLIGTTAPKGTGEIVIREFLPVDEVLQVVQDGSAHPIGIDRNGNAKAIYVEGQWLSRGKMSPSIWSSIGRRELISQQNGVVFWIAGDQLDGINLQTLMSISQSMGPFTFSSPSFIKENSVTVLQADDSSVGPFANDVLAIFSNDGVTGPYYIDVSSYVAAINASAGKITTHGH